MAQVFELCLAGDRLRALLGQLYLAFLLEAYFGLVLFFLLALIFASLVTHDSSLRSG